MWSFARIAAKIPRMNPIRLTAMMIGTAPITKDRRGVNSSVTLVMMGEILSLSVAALAYCTTVVLTSARVPAIFTLWRLRESLNAFP